MDDIKTKNTASTGKTLDEGDIVNAQPVGRRSAMASVGLGVLGALGLAVGLKPSTAEAQNCTDSDGGPYADAAGYGRRCRVYYRPPAVVVVRRQGCTDSDGGPYSDPGGGGRRCGVYVVPVQRTCTDSDAGSYADAAGRGRNCGGY